MPPVIAQPPKDASYLPAVLHDLKPLTGVLDQVQLNLVRLLQAVDPVAQPLCLIPSIDSDFPEARDTGGKIADVKARCRCRDNQCLIADRDGVYDASTPNGRLLLGMKGIVSEVELHTLRGRLIAGVQQKAQRGDLALALPAGLPRQEDGDVVKDPDRAVQHAITCV